VARAGAVILHAVQAGEGPPVVLLHGLFGSARNLAAVQRALSPRYRVIAMDLRNHGASPHAAGMDYATQAADVRETMQALGVSVAAVVGHSMGGKTAMRLALDTPGIVSALAVADIAPVPYPPHFRDYADAMRQVPGGVSRAAAGAALAEVVEDPGVRGFLLQNLRPGETPVWRIGLDYIAEALPEIEGWEALTGARYDGPVLIVAGDRSDYVQAEHRGAVRALFPRARFVKVRNAGHWLHADNLPGFVSVLDAFLSRSVGST
jgi:esterase